MISKAMVVSKPLCTTIYLDGVKIEGVTKFSISQEVGEEIPRLVLETVCEEIHIDAEVEYEKSATQ